MADIIVVGAGSAGAVVARRLHDLGAEVLVLESGPAEGGAAVADPARMHELWDSPLDWGWRTVPQPAAGDRRLHLPRGRVLGGSHALNGMIWARGCPRDYDGWAAAGNPGWAWRDVLPAFRRIEAYDEPGALRGVAGPLPILTRWEPLPVQRSIVAAAVAAGVPFNPDYNGVRPEGVSYMQYTIAGGRRRTTAEAYLRPALDRPGLTVRTGVTVRRLLLRGGRPARCTGVEWTAGPAGGRSGAPERAWAGTVVLCAGALGSPELLLRSGIGDPGELRAAGVSPRVALPGVGRGLQDHWLVPVIFSVDRKVGAPEGLPACQSHLFWRSAPDRPLPDLQPIHFAAPLYEPWMDGPPDGITLLAGLVRPASSGTVRIAGPAGPPLIDPRVLSREADLVALEAAVRLCRRIGTSAALRDEWGARELYPGTDGGDLRGYIRRTVITYHHQSGTCRMGAAGDAHAVVDARLRVRGVAGLRVADASVMPRIPTGNTNAPTVMIGERAAEFVAAETAGR